MTEKNHTRIAMAIALFAAIGSAQAASDLKVRLSTDASSAKSQSVIVTATFTNEGDEAAYIYRPESPFGRYDDEPASDFLKVKDSSGNPVQYIGSRDHWGPVEASHFVTVAPGQTVQKRVDITNAYAFGAGGVFTVRYASYRRTPPGAPRRAQGHAPLPPLESDEAVIVVDKLSDQAIVYPIAELTCTADQDTVIQRIIVSAKGRANNASAAFSNMYKPIRQPDGSLNYIYRPSKRFDRWFGAVASDDPLPHQEGWYESDNSSAKDAIAAVFNRLFNAAYVSPLKASCGCPGRPPETVAHAEDTNLYAIGFCERFFTIPDDDPVISKIGAMVHEMSHFHDRFSPGLSDYGYGKTCAQDLARSDKATTVRNADNLEFFVMDTTPYDEATGSLTAGHVPKPLPPSCTP